MDPNRTLVDLRDWAEKTIADAEATHCSVDEEVASVAEQFLALDRWLTRGGFLPTPWRQKPTNATKELELLRQDLQAAQSKLASALRDLSTFPQNAPSEPQKPAQAPGTCACGSNLAHKDCCRLGHPK